jgi:hypothetical protein
MVWYESRRRKSSEKKLCSSCTLFSAGRTYDALEMNSRSKVEGPQGSVIQSTFYVSPTAIETMWWGVKTYGARRCVSGKNRIQGQAVREQLDREHKETPILLKVGNYSPNLTESHPINLNFNPLKTKHRLVYLRTQFVPRSKHFSSRL